MALQFDDANRQHAPPSRGREPLFYVSIHLNDAQPIPENEVLKVETDDFNLPPRGTSKESDFDLLCHLEIEPEVDEKNKGEDDDDGTAVPETNQVFEKKYKLTVPKI